MKAGKTRKLSRYGLLAGVAVVAGFVAHAAGGEVVAGTNLILTYQPEWYSWADYELRIGQDPTNESWTSIFFDQLDPTTFTFAGTLLDEGSDWYLVSYNDRFSRGAIAAGAFPAADDYFSPPIVVPIGGYFEFLGVATSFACSGDGVTRDIFGWAKLYNDGGLLTIADSAMAYEYEGIIVGTLIPIVPEPASAGLVLGGMSLLALRRRRRGLL